jgi:uncharacterized protein YecE (DUF72 family)
LAGATDDEEERAMRVRSGTSGWSYDEWKGSFYPDDLAKDEMLGYYARRLHAVEVNNTFYRLPKKEVVAGWAEQTPDDFSFVLKASRRITHNAKLGPDALDPLGHLVASSAALGTKRGPILFQTPPWLKRDLGILESFLDAVPEGVRAAFEFRSTSWFTDDVYDVLREGGAALVVADTGDEAKDPPLVVTASFGYARLRREAYAEDQLEEWASRFRETGWEDLWVFFKHEDEGSGPGLAARFQERMEG